MAEYIEREATRELYCQKCKGYYDGHCVHQGECDVDVIDTAPAADVQPVKRGHWRDHHCKHIEQLDANFIQAKCTCCGRYSDKIDSYCRYLDLEYCSHCGADMREVKHDNSVLR